MLASLEAAEDVEDLAAIADADEQAAENEQSPEEEQPPEQVVELRKAEQQPDGSPDGQPSQMSEQSG